MSFILLKELNHLNGSSQEDRNPPAKDWGVFFDGLLRGRHPVEPARGGQETGSRSLLWLSKHWIPASAGMTERGILDLLQKRFFAVKAE
jgi:hypothetical protein